MPVLAFLGEMPVAINRLKRAEKFLCPVRFASVNAQKIFSKSAFVQKGRPSVFTLGMLLPFNRKPIGKINYKNGGCRHFVFIE